MISIQSILFLFFFLVLLVLPFHACQYISLEWKEKELPPIVPDENGSYDITVVRQHNEQTGTRRAIQCYEMVTRTHGLLCDSRVKRESLGPKKIIDDVHMFGTEEEYCKLQLQYQEIVPCSDILKEEL